MSISNIVSLNAYALKRLRERGEKTSSPPPLPRERFPEFESDSETHPETDTSVISPSVKDWHHKYVSKSFGDSVTTTHAYESYCNHCVNSNHHPLPLPAFHRQWRDYSGHPSQKFAGRIRHLDIKIKNSIDEVLASQTGYEGPLGPKNKKRLGGKKKNNLDKVADRDNLGGVSHIGEEMKHLFEENAPMSNLTKKVLGWVKSNTKTWDDRNGNGDEIFKASNVKPTSANPTYNSNHTYNWKNDSDWNKDVQEEGVILESHKKMSHIVNSYNDASWEEHDQYLNRGAKEKRYNQKRWDKAERESSKWNNEFKKHFRHLIPEKDRHSFNLGHYDTGDVDKFVKAWLGPKPKNIQEETDFSKLKMGTGHLPSKDLHTLCDADHNVIFQSNKWDDVDRVANGKLGKKHGWKAIKAVNVEDNFDYPHESKVSKAKVDHSIKSTKNYHIDEDFNYLKKSDQIDANGRRIPNKPRPIPEKPLYLDFVNKKPKPRMTYIDVLNKNKKR